MKKIIFIILAGFILQGCGSDPVSSSGGINVIYQNSSIVDSITATYGGNITTREQSLGNLDFSNASKLYIRYDYKDSIVGWEIYVNLSINDSIYYTRYLEENTGGKYQTVKDSCNIPEYTGETKFKITLWYSAGYAVFKNLIISKK